MAEKYVGVDKLLATRHPILFGVCINIYATFFDANPIIRIGYRVNEQFINAEINIKFKTKGFESCFFASILEAISATSDLDHVT